ncbi:MAG: hypothetical protein LJE68_09170 [Rhodobacter sp.]|nr:hypothetical protein [Rhodobacter sp.]
MQETTAQTSDTTRVRKALDWAVFALGAASLSFAIAGTVVAKTSTVSASANQTETPQPVTG